MAIQSNNLNQVKKDVMLVQTIQFKNVSYLWDDATAASYNGDEVALLVYRSNLMGADLRLTNYGGGNT